MVYVFTEKYLSVFSHAMYVLNTLNLNIMINKCPLILSTLYHTSGDLVLLFMQLFLNILCGTANSVNPDQMALKEQSDPGLQWLH